MAQKALLIGVKGGKSTLLDYGDPRDIRDKFKHSDGEGFDALEVFESSVGRSRKKSFNKAGKTVVAEPEPAPEPEPEPVLDDEPEVADSPEPDEIETLITLAKGDARKSETKEARKKLDDLGVAY